MNKEDVFNIVKEMGITIHTIEDLTTILYKKFDDAIKKAVSEARMDEYRYINSWRRK